MCYLYQLNASSMVAQNKFLQTLSGDLNPKSFDYKLDTLTFGPTENSISVNLLQMSCVVTWACLA